MPPMRDRSKPDRKKEVSFLRAFVNHHSFVTGLTKALKDGVIPEKLEDSSIGLNVILHADIIEGYKVVNPLMFHFLEEAPYHNVLEGALFECCDLLSYIAGTYDSKQLKNLEGQPTEFTIETWMSDNEYDWQLKRKTHWKGVKWLDAAHTGDGDDRACAGIATFTCEEKAVEEIIDGETIQMDRNIKHPGLNLKRVIQRTLLDPKHPSNYLG